MYAFFMTICHSQLSNSRRHGGSASRIGPLCRLVAALVVFHRPQPSHDSRRTRARPNKQPDVTICFALGQPCVPAARFGLLLAPDVGCIPGDLLREPIWPPAWLAGRKCQFVPIDGIARNETGPITTALTTSAATTTNNHNHNHNQSHLE